MYCSKKDQSVLFPYAEESPKFLTKRIQRRTSLDNMLKSYRKSLKVISCWHSLETVLEYFEKGFEEITLVVGFYIILMVMFCEGGLQKNYLHSHKSKSIWINN